MSLKFKVNTVRSEMEVVATGTPPPQYEPLGGTGSLL